MAKMSFKKIATIFYLCVLCTGMTIAVLPASGQGQAGGFIYLTDDTDSVQSPMTGVLVTDGYSFAETNEEGYYQIDLHEHARWVAFVNPQGTTPTEQLYYMVPDDSDEIEHAEYNFTVTSAKHAPNEPFRFVHHSDLHFHSQSDVENIYNGIARHVHRMPDRPAFIIDSGDVSVDSRKTMEFAREYFDYYKIPAFTVQGNHDRVRIPGVEAYRGQTMEELFYPLYYGFTYNNYLFLNYPWETDSEASVNWTEKLLSRIGHDYHIVINLHHWSGLGPYHADLYELAREYEAKAVLSGHYHTNQVMDIDGLPSFAIARGGPGHQRALDYPSINVFTAYPDGKLVADYRNTQFEQHVRLVYPSETAPFWRGQVSPVQVNAYDTALDVVRVRVSIHNPQNNARITSVALENNGGHAWAGRLIPDSNWPDEVVVQVEVTDEQRETWEKIQRHVRVSNASRFASPATDVDWGMYRGGPDRTGFSEKSTVVPPLRLAWVHLDRSFGLSAPVVANGRVFAGIANNQTANDPVPVIISLDGVTGEQLWSYEIQGRSIRNTLATDGETVVAHLDDGKIIGLDANSGQLIWENTNMMRRYQNMKHPSGIEHNQIFLRGSPMIVGNRFFIGLQDFGGVGSLKTGRFYWKHLPDQGVRSFANPSWTKSQNILLRPGSSIQAIDPETGELIWQEDIALSQVHAISFGGQTTPVFDGETFYYPAPPESRQWAVQALDAESGDIRWQTSLEGQANRVFSSAAVGPQRLYFALGESGNQIYALDKVSGEVDWKLEFLEDGSGFEAGVVLAGEYLYAVTTNGRLYGLEAASGKVVWQHDLYTKVSSGIAVSGNMLYITGHNGAMYAFVSITEIE